MKRIHICKVNTSLFFIPTLSVGKIYSKMILPIIEKSGFEENSIVGESFIKTFEKSVIGDIPNGDSGAFKKLIDLSKLKTHKNFVAKALCLVDQLKYIAVR